MRRWVVTRLGPFGTAQLCRTTVALQAEIGVKAPRGVLLDDETTRSPRVFRFEPPLGSGVFAKSRFRWYSASAFASARGSPRRTLLRECHRATLGVTIMPASAAGVRGRIFATGSGACRAPDTSTASAAGELLRWDPPKGP
jgi:hypothetical protein